MRVQMMSSWKKTQFIAVIFAVIAAAAMLVVPQGVAHAAGVKDTLSAATYQQVYETHYVNKAHTQAIVLTASDSDYSDAELWFVSGSGTKRIYTPTLSLYPSSSFCCSVKGGKIFKIEEGGYGSASGSRLWFVKNGTVKRLSNVGMGVMHVKGNIFTTEKNRFDANKYQGNWTGHTYNRYYLKWTGSKFVEYGGKAISKATLKRAKNGVKVLKTIKRHEKKAFGTTARIGKIFYRGNGIVNINVSEPNRYGSGRDFCNYTLRLKGKKLVFCNPKTLKKCSIADARNLGSYLKKSGYASAKYPRRFPV